MKIGDQTRTQFGVRVSASSKVARSLFPQSILKKGGKKIIGFPDATILSSTSEVTKNWDTTDILERETENNSEVFQLAPAPSTKQDNAADQENRGQSREAKVVDIFDQCLKQYRRKRPEARTAHRDTQPRSKSKRS